MTSGWWSTSTHSCRTISAGSTSTQRLPLTVTTVVDALNAVFYMDSTSGTVHVVLTKLYAVA
jgi:hypothetical protein